MDDLISVVDWSRWQFALTAMYHWLFVPLTIGLALIVAIHGEHLCKDEGGKVACNDKILDVALRYQLRDWSGYRNYPGI